MTFLFQYYRVFRETNQMRRVYIISMYVVGGWNSSQIPVAVLVVVFSLGLVACVFTTGRISSLHGDLFDAKVY